MEGDADLVDGRAFQQQRQLFRQQRTVGGETDAEAKLLTNVQNFRQLWVQERLSQEINRLGGEALAASTKELMGQKPKESSDSLMRKSSALEARMAARAQESDNTTAAYVGQLEQQLRARGDGVITPIV